MSKHILITGCSTGFGFDAAKSLAERGHRVHATMRDIQGRNLPAALALRAFAKDKGLSLDVHEMDVLSDDSVNAAVAAMGPIEVLINNAGAGYCGPIESFTSKQMLAQLDLNIVGTLRVVKAVLPGMRERASGLIIQLSSIAGRGAFPGFGIYHASKWGLEGVSEALRYELSPLGIDVVLVEPGPFSTSFFGNIIPGDDEQAAAAYPHVGAFFEGFENSVQEAFADGDAPTDPQLVVDLFAALIDMEDGERPLRSMVGMDFGLQAMNETSEPIRREALAAMEIADWDGPIPKAKA